MTGGWNVGLKIEDVPVGYLKPGPDGALVWIIVCERCGALVMLPGHERYVDIHDKWHRGLDRRMGL